MANLLYGSFFRSAVWEARVLLQRQQYPSIHTGNHPSTRPSTRYSYLYEYIRVYIYVRARVCVTDINPFS